MADGCLLLVDAVDGPMPQTTNVLKTALSQGVTPMVVINKIDRPEARVAEVVELVQDLFLELANEPEQLDFPVLYASGRHGHVVSDLNSEPKDMQPLFDAILEYVPPPAGDPDAPLQMLVAALDYDNYLGQVAIGRVFRGTIRLGDQVALLGLGGRTSFHKLDRVHVFRGLERLEVREARAGDIVAVTGVENVSIGDTIAAPEGAEALPTIEIDEPTVKMTFGVNTSPFMGKEGTHSTSRMLHERLVNELRTNVSLRVETTDTPDIFLVSGRGELHLSILVETMRREGFEFQVSKPEPVTKVIDGKVHEPYEQLNISTRDQYLGPLTEYLSGRLAQLVDMKYDEAGNVDLECRIPTRGLIGFTSFFLRTTRGHGVQSSVFIGYQTMEGDIKSANTGVLVAWEPGVAVTYGLLNAQGRGDTFIDPGTPVYEGMIVGMHRRAGGHYHQRVQREEDDQHALVHRRYHQATQRHRPDESGRSPRLHRCRRASRGHPTKLSHPQEGAVHCRPLPSSGHRREGADRLRLATLNTLSEADCSATATGRPMGSGPRIASEHQLLLEQKRGPDGPLLALKLE